MRESEEFAPCPACVEDPGWAVCAQCRGEGCVECNASGEVVCPLCGGAEFVPVVKATERQGQRTIALTLGYDRAAMATQLTEAGYGTTVDDLKAALNAALDKAFDGAVWVEG